MQAELNLILRVRPPAPVRFALSFVLGSARDRADAAHCGFEAKQFRRNPAPSGLSYVKSGGEVAGMSPVLLEIYRALAVKEAAGPGELLAHRSGPDLSRKGST